MEMSTRRRGGTLNRSMSSLSVVQDDTTSSPMLVFTPRFLFDDNDDAVSVSSTTISNLRAIGGSNTPSTPQAQQDVFLSPQVNLHVHHHTYFRIHPMMTWLAISTLLVVVMILIAIEHSWVPPYVGDAETVMDNDESMFPSDRVFAEARAKKTVDSLAKTIGQRNTPEARAATSLFVLESLRKCRRESRRHKYEIQIKRQTANITVPVHDDTEHEEEVTVVNVMARITGVSDSNSSVLLVAYYDSFGPEKAKDCGVGANDNAVGVAMLLELFHVMSHSPTPPQHSVIFLFTDYHYSHVATATGKTIAPMLGARVFAKHSAWSRDARVVLVMESFGSGRLMHIRSTSDAALSLLSSSLPWPVAHSALEHYATKIAPFHDSASELDVFSSMEVSGDSDSVVGLPHVLLWGGVRDHVIVRTKMDHPDSAIAASVLQFGGVNLQRFVEYVSGLAFLPSVTNKHDLNSAPKKNPPTYPDPDTHPLSAPSRAVHGSSTTYFTLLSTNLWYGSTEDAHVIFIVPCVFVVAVFLLQLTTPYRLSIDHNRPMVWRGAQRFSTYWKTVGRVCVVLIFTTLLSCGVCVAVAELMKLLRYWRWMNSTHATVLRGTSRWFGTTCGLFALAATLFGVLFTPSANRTRRSHAFRRISLHTLNTRRSLPTPFTQQTTGETQVFGGVLVFEALVVLVFECFGNGLPHHVAYIPFSVVVTLLFGAILYSLADFVVGASFWLLRYLCAFVPVIMTVEACVLFISLVEGMELETNTPAWVGLFFGLLIPVGFGGVIPMLLHAGASIHIPKAALLMLIASILCFVVTVVAHGTPLTHSDVAKCS